MEYRPPISVHLSNLKTCGTWYWYIYILHKTCSQHHANYTLYHALHLKVDWAGNGPENGIYDGDCAILITDGPQKGQVTNKDTQCTDYKNYCCNPIPITTATECPRIRKEWNTMSQSERDLYINGMLQLSYSGILDRFTVQHGDPSTVYNHAHGTSAFLSWHRLFIWELETQIRNLGGDYECFSLPYWNVGKDVHDHGYDYTKYSILNSDLGSTGNPYDNYCVSEGAFTKYVYKPHHCPQEWKSTITGDCCLRRITLNDSSSGWLPTNAQVAALITQNNFYGDDTAGMRTYIENSPHGIARMLIYKEIEKVRQCIASNCTKYFAFNK